MAITRGRSLLTTLVGWLLVAMIVWFVFGWVIGVIRVLVRFAVILVVIGALAALWFKLRDDA